MNNIATNPAPPIRWRHAIRAAAWHMALSVFVAGLVAFLIFIFWFSELPYKLTGGVELFGLIISVDMVCGPLLTFVIFNPAKPRTELLRDLTLVAIIQLLAMGYGIQTLSYARPLVLVYEVDRFRVISSADLDEAEADQIPAWAQAWGLSPPRTMGIRPPKSEDEKLASISASLQGIESSQRPSWWQDYALNIPQILQRAHPVSVLRTKHPEQLAHIDTAITNALKNTESGETTDPNALRWLPLVSRRALDWVVLLDPTTARVRGYVHVDGF